MTAGRITKTLALSAVAALALVGCGAGSDDAEEPITLGYLPSWTDGLASAYLLENQLTELGYSVEMETLSEAGPLFAGLAEGDIDVYPSAWPELTHASYAAQYGDSLEDLGEYYSNGQSMIAVPSYVDIDSIEGLAGQAERFGGKIYGIEPGAGLTALSEGMLETYGLDEYELVTSSTPAMLAELDSAIAEGRDIVVTFWKPFWANGVYDVKALEDPRGAMGGTEGMHYLASKGFSEEYPDVAELLGDITLNDSQYSALENMVVNEYGEGRETEAVEAWIEQFPEALPDIASE